MPEPITLEPNKTDRRSWFSVARGFNEDGTLNIMASTENVDRHGEIVRAEAFKPNMKVYRSNPVILAAHDHWLLTGESPVIARSEHEKIIPKVGLEQQIRFIPAELYPAGTLQLGPLYEALYRQKFMNTFSIGFIPIEWRREDPESRLEYTEIDHLETSAVVVPSNRESLAKAADENGAGAKLAKWCLKHLSGDISEREWDPKVIRSNYRALQGAVRSLRTEIGEALEEARAAITVNADTGNMNIQLDPEVDTLEVIEGTDKTVVPFKKYPLAEDDQSWSWKTSDQDAVLGESNWKRYVTVHTWFDPEADEENSPPEVKGAYKLPHHKVLEGGIKTVFRGVAAAMGALLGARGGVDIPDADRQKVYNHLARHYGEFDKEPPEFRAYDAAEFKQHHLDHDCWSDGIEQDLRYADLPEHRSAESCSHGGITSDDVNRLVVASRAMQDAAERNEFVLAQMEGLVVRAESAAKGHPTSTEPSHRDSDATGSAADDKETEILRGLDRINATAQAAHNGRS